MFGPLTEIGKTIKPHNLNGEVKLAVQKKFRPSFIKTEWLFLDVKNSKVPFKILSMDGEDVFIIKLDDINNREDAQNICNCKAYLRNEDIGTLDEEGNGLDILVNFDLFDTTGDYIGTIHDIVEYPEQVMAIVLNGEKEHLIPLNEEFVQEISPEENSCILNLPKGLLDL